MKKILFVLCSCLFVLVACGKQEEPRVNEEAANETYKEADEKNLKVTLKNREGMEVGLATLSKAEEGVNIHVMAEGLNEGIYGFHVHKKGICEAPTFESAGGHFNPTNKEHGFNNPKGPHAGDIENIEVAADGTVDQIFLNDRLTWEKNKVNSIFQTNGLALIIHERADDYISQPAGDAGERKICGVIGHS